MGWYDHVYNYTKKEHSKNEYKYSNAPHSLILNDQPDWSPDDVIIGTGTQDLGSDYFFITGQDKYTMTNIREKVGGYDFTVGYKLTEVPELHVCDERRVMLDSDDNVVTVYSKGAWYSKLEPIRK